MNSLKRLIDRILSQGEGRQLAWLAGVALALFLLLVLAGSFWALGWTEILNLYLDPGSYPLEAKQGSQASLNIFSLLIAFGGILVLNALTVSAFSNVFDNISEKYRKGERRYKLKGHVLILGGGQQLCNMLKGIGSDHQFDGKDIVVMTSADVETLREKVETALGDPKLCRRIVWYRGERDGEDDLRSACADKASFIYIIGEDGEEAHDAASIAALEHLQAICATEGTDIPCYVTLEMHTSQDVFDYLKAPAESRLRVEIVHTGDYIAEQLLVDTDFLPVPADDESLHLVIAGSGRIARSVALVAAQICHFPGYARSGRRTLISLVGWSSGEMDNFVANHQNLFDLSHYTSVSPVGRTAYVPKSSYGDFLDIEWEFIESSLASPLVRGKLEGWAADSKQRLALVLCHEDAAADTNAFVHLPKAVYGIPVAVYLKDHPELLAKAATSGQFGSPVCFGEAAPGSDPLLLRRSIRGMRVNYLYDHEYGGKSATPEDAWAGLSFAHKLSSIASANSIPLKLRAFGIEPTRSAVDALDADTLAALSEVEHRRWMLTVLLMGYSAFPLPERSDRSRFRELKNEHFVHLDIAPFSELDPTEAGKDTVIVKNIPFIINGE